MKTRVLIIFIFIFISSCYKSFRYNIDNNNKINIMCFLKANDTVRVNISHSFNLNEGEEYDREYINDAEVFLYENGQLKEKLINKKNNYSGGWYFSKSFIPRENNKYKLEVYISGYDTVYAETFIPKKVKIDTITYLFNFSIDEFKDTNYSLEHFIKFRDNIDKNNYYSFNIFSLNSVTHYKSYDPAIEDKNMGTYFSFITSNINNKPYFSDSLFANNYYTLKVSNSFHYFVSDTMIFYDEFYTLSSDAYFYYKSSYIQYSTKDNPFSEPVVIYSNIVNGTGIFAGMSADIDSIVLIKNKLK